MITSDGIYKIIQSIYHYITKEETPIGHFVTLFQQNNVTCCESVGNNGRKVGFGRMSSGYVQTHYPEDKRETEEIKALSFVLQFYFPHSQRYKWKCREPVKQR
jgi:hypothetical protein